MKLDGELIAVARAYRKGGDVAEKALVQSKKVSTVGGRLRVGITVANKDDLPFVRTKPQQVGAKITVEFGNRVFAIVPIAALETTAAEEEVWSITVPRRVAAPIGH